MTTDELADIKANIRSLVIASGVTGLRVKYLQKEYEEMLDEKIPFWKFGCKSMLEFLKGSCRDVCRIGIGREYPEEYAFMVADEKTAHMKALQEKTNSKRKKKKKIAPARMYSRPHGHYGQTYRIPSYRPKVFTGYSGSRAPPKTHTSIKKPAATTVFTGYPIPGTVHYSSASKPEVSVIYSGKSLSRARGGEDLPTAKPAVFTGYPIPGMAGLAKNAPPVGLSLMSTAFTGYPIPGMVKSTQPPISQGLKVTIRPESRSVQQQDSRFDADFAVTLQPESRQVTIQEERSPIKITLSHKSEARMVKVCRPSEENYILDNGETIKEEANKPVVENIIEPKSEPVLTPLNNYYPNIGQKSITPLQDRLLRRKLCRYDTEPTEYGDIKTKPFIKKEKECVDSTGNKLSLLTLKDKPKEELQQQILPIKQEKGFVTISDYTPMSRIDPVFKSDSDWSTTDDEVDQIEASLPRGDRKKRMQQQSLPVISDIGCLTKRRNDNPCIDSDSDWSTTDDEIVQIAANPPSKDNPCTEYDSDWSSSDDEMARIEAESPRPSEIFYSDSDFGSTVDGNSNDKTYLFIAEDEKPSLECVCKRTPTLVYCGKCQEIIQSNSRVKMICEAHPGIFLTCDLLVCPECLSADIHELR